MHSPSNDRGPNVWIAWLQRCFFILVLLIVATALHPASAGASPDLPPNPSECGDGQRQPGETCANCPLDVVCPQGQHCDVDLEICVSNSSVCGNGQCEQDENCENCWADCRCLSGEACLGGACFPIPPGTPFCGNDVCEPGDGENCRNCARDCACQVGEICRAYGACEPAPVTCDDGICSPGENCCLDCGCPLGSTCSGNICVLTGNGCGDGSCTAPAEDCSSCALDCHCAAGTQCTNGTCAGSGGACDFDGEPDPGESCASCPADLAARPDLFSSLAFPTIGEPVVFTLRPGALRSIPAPTWLFGDGAAGAGPVAQHAFGAAGNYPVTVRGTDAVCGAQVVSDPFIQHVIEERCTLDPGDPTPSCCGNGQCDPSDRLYCPAECLPPDVSCDTGTMCNGQCASRPVLSASATTIRAGQSVDFVVASGTNASTVNWDFGDAQHCIACARSVSHQYLRPGNYHVLLTATDDVCGTAQVSLPHQVRVLPASPIPTPDTGVPDSRLAIDGTPRCVQPGTRGSFQLAYQNTGDTVWLPGAGYGLRVPSAADPPPHFATSAFFPIQGTATVPAKVATFTIPFEAPVQPGDYRFRAQMVDGQGAEFGAIASAAVHVGSDCPGVATGDFVCTANVRTPSGGGVGGLPVAITASIVDADGQLVVVSSDEEHTRENGFASVGISPAEVVQRVECRVRGLDTYVSGSPVAILTDPVAVPVPQQLAIDVVIPFDFREYLRFPGLNPRDLSEFFLLQTGPYDRPFIFPMPFDPKGDLTPSKLRQLIQTIAAPLAPLGLDIWVTSTFSHKNYHEQAAELAQAMDYVSSEHRMYPATKTIVFGYSGGGIASRLATARWESDSGWRSALGALRDENPVDLLIIGDSPQTGANANYCLQWHIWNDIHPFTSQADKLGLDGCAAQVLLRESFPTGTGSFESFWEQGDAVTFPLIRGAKGRGCDRKVGGNCVCDPGPPLKHVNGNGWPHQPRIVAFGSSIPEGPNRCYAELDKNRSLTGEQLCGFHHLNPAKPYDFEVGLPLFKIRRALLSDVVCSMEAGDTEAGSKFGSQIHVIEGFGIKGGVDSLDGFTFIPADSSLPSGAPFDEIRRGLDHHGAHGRFYPGDIQWMAARVQETLATRPVATTAERTESRLSRSTSSGVVEVTLPNPSGTGQLDVITTTGSPTQHPGYSPGALPSYHRVTTTQGFQASPDDPITVCVGYADGAFSSADRVELMAFGPNGWQPITSLRHHADRKVCGNATALGDFALLEPVNHLPIVNAGPDQPAAGGDVLLTALGALDPDDEPLELSWYRLGSGGVPTGDPIGLGHGTRVSLPIGLHQFRLVARDARGGTVSDDVTVNVVTGNRAPVIERIRTTPFCHPLPAQPCTVNLVVDAHDPDGDALSYAWSGGSGGDDGSSCGPSSIGSAAGGCTMRRLESVFADVVVTDPHGASASSRVRVHGVNDAPTLLDAAVITPPPPMAPNQVATWIVPLESDDDDAAGSTCVATAHGACDAIGSRCSAEEVTLPNGAKYHAGVEVTVRARASASAGICEIRASWTDPWGAEGKGGATANVRPVGSGCGLSGAEAVLALAILRLWGARGGSRRP